MKAILRKEYLCHIVEAKVIHVTFLATINGQVLIEVALRKNKYKAHTSILISIKDEFKNNVVEKPDLANVWEM